MKLEILMSTMNRESMEFTKDLNIKSDLTVVNQISTTIKYNDIYDYNTRVINVKEKGLSKSRNMAIKNSRNDIILITDDDVSFVDGYEEKILDYHHRYKDIDIICFKVLRSSNERNTKQFLKTKRISFIGSLKVSSVEISIKKRFLEKTKIRFDENFGSGSGNFNMGEENIFLYDALRKGAKILYVPFIIGKTSFEESSWFKGYNDKFFKDLGAVYYRMSKFLMIPLSIQFLLRKRGLFKERRFIYNYKLMKIGKKQYKKLVKEK